MLSKAAAKYIQSLHHKKFRDKEELLIAEGDKILKDIIQSKKFDCRIICGTTEWFDDNFLLVNNLVSTEKIVVTEQELDKISTLSTPKNALAIFKQPAAEEIILKDSITLMLDDISDPGNMGTLIRIADWFGIKNIICSTHCVEQYNPKVVQATMGSIARLNIVYTSLPDFIKRNPVENIFSAALNGEPVSSLNNIKEAILIIGNESKGISSDVQKLSTKKITISGYGAAESLNAAVAAGIILSYLRK